MEKNILYVEDDPSLSFVTIDNLSLKGYKVFHAPTAEEGLQIFQENAIDLCILDIMLPNMNGFELSKKIRTVHKEVPILFLSAKSLTEDRITGFKTGADDYIVKPFHIEELCHKIEIFLKRNKISSTPTSTIFQLGKLYSFDYKNMTLSGSKERKLTQKEAELLLYFIKNHKQVVSRKNILETLWGKDDYFLGRSLDVFISRLRKYLVEDPDIQLENRHGIGFIFSYSKD